MGEAAREADAIADGRDRRIGRGEEGIDLDAVAHGQAGGFRKLLVRQDADPDEHEIGRQPVPVGGPHGDRPSPLPLDGGDTRLE